MRYEVADMAYNAYKSTRFLRGIINECKKRLIEQVDSYIYDIIYVYEISRVGKLHIHGILGSNKKIIFKRMQKKFFQVFMKDVINVYKWRQYTCKDFARTDLPFL